MPRGYWPTLAIPLPVGSWKGSITKSKLSPSAPMASTMRISSSSNCSPYITLGTNFSDEPQKLKPPHTPKARGVEGVVREVEGAKGAPRVEGDLEPIAAAQHTVGQWPDWPARIG